MSVVFWRVHPITNRFFCPVSQYIDMKILWLCVHYHQALWLIRRELHNPWHQVIILSPVGWLRTQGHCMCYIKVEALWFGCYGIIIWFPSGKNESEWFLLFSLRDIFLLYSCAQFSVCILTQVYYHVTKELCVWLITRYTFHAHCCVIYQRTITQDADVIWEDQNFIKFPSKIVRFCHFLWKVICRPHFFIWLFWSI